MSSSCRGHQTFSTLTEKKKKKRLQPEPTSNEFILRFGRCVILVVEAEYDFLLLFYLLGRIKNHERFSWFFVVDLFPL